MSLQDRLICAVRSMGSALIFMCGCLTLPMPAQAAPTRIATAAQFDADLAITNFVIGSIVSRNAAELQDDRLRAAYYDIDRLRQQVVQARKQLDVAQAQTRASGLGERAARHELQQLRLRYESEASTYKQAADKWLAEIKARDVQAKAALQAYEESLSGIFKSEEPETLAIIERLNAGDLEALDELDAWNRAKIIEGDRAAELSNLARRRQDALRLRNQAIVWGGYADKGKRTAVAVLDVWQRAVALDPTIVGAWREVYRYALLSNNRPAEVRAIDEIWSRAATPYERQLAARICAGGVNRIGADQVCDKRSGADSYALLGVELARSELNKNRADFLLRIDLLAALEAVGQLQVADKRFVDAAAEELWERASSYVLDTPDSSTMFGFYARAIARRPLDWNNPDAVTKVRQVIERSVADDRALRALNPESLSVADQLVSSLTQLCWFNLNSNSTGPAETCFDEVVAIARQRVASDPDTRNARFRLWMALQDSGRAQMRIGNAAKALEMYTLMLAEDSDEDKSVSLYRLNEAQIALGDVTAAEATLRQRMALKRAFPSGSISWPSGRRIPLEEELFDLEMVDAQLKWIARRHDEANAKFMELLIRLDSGSLAELSASERTEQAVTIQLMMYQIALEQGRFDLANTRLLAIEQSAAAIASGYLKDASGAPVSNNLLNLSLRAARAELPGSGIGWQEVLAELKAAQALPMIDPVNRQRISVMQEFATLRAREPVPIGTPQEIARRNFEASWRLVETLLSREPSNANFVSIWSYHTKIGPMILPDQFAWAYAAERYVNARQRGWIDALNIESDWLFVVGRAAFDARRAQAKAVRTPKGKQ